MGRADFPDSAHICIIQEFLGMSIKPAQNKLVLQVASDQTLFKIDFKLGVDLPPVLPVSGPFFVISIVARSVWRFTQTLGCFRTSFLFIILSAGVEYYGYGLHPFYGLSTARFPGLSQSYMHISPHYIP